jgi:hypothetical protein
VALGWLWVALRNPLSDFSFQHFSFCPSVALGWLFVLLEMAWPRHASRITHHAPPVFTLTPPPDLSPNCHLIVNNFNTESPCLSALKFLGYGKT